MEKRIEKLKCTDLAYWLGVAQTDGHFYQHLTNKGPNRKPHFTQKVVLSVCEKSLPMLQKFMNISNYLFGRNTCSWKDQRGYYTYSINIASEINNLYKLGLSLKNHPNPPNWISEDILLFGAYLAGVIDGDGSIKSKHNKDRTIPQCSVGIYSRSPQYELKEAIIKNLNCRANILFESHCYGLHFYISKHKNLEIVSKYLLPHINITHKKERIINKIGAHSSAWIEHKLAENAHENQQKA